MQRTLIRIDESRCDGCGLCVDACHEGAIRLVDGKARLVSDLHCDGLGACLGECPQGAIALEVREAPAFVGPVPAAAPVPLPAANARAAFERAMAKAPVVHEAPAGGCPGSALRELRPAVRAPVHPDPAADAAPGGSRLSHWPVQLMLVPTGAAFLRGADLVVCADCVPFAVPDFHGRYLDGRAIVVGCPKLDDLPYYREKLAALVAEARPASLTVVRMEVPCCGGIARAVTDARDASMPGLPVEVHTVTVHGDVRREIA